MPSLLNSLTTGVAYETEEAIQAREGNSSFSQKLSRAMLDESALAMGIANITSMDTQTTDAEFVNNTKIKDDIYKSYEPYIKPEFKNYIMENSKNIYDYKDKLEFYKNQTNLEKEIEDMGISGMFLRMGGALPDVIPLVGATLTAPVSATAIGTSVALRTLLGGTLATTAEGIRREIGDRERTTLESVLSIGLGTAVAGAFGKAGIATLEVAKNDIKRTLKYDNELEQQIIQAEKGELKNQDGSLITKEDIIKARAKEVGLSQNQYKTFDTVLKEVELEAKKKNFDEGFASALRVDLAHLTKKSQSDSMSYFGKQAFPDSTLQTNTAGKQYLAEISLEVERRIQQSVANNFAELINKYGSLAYGKGTLRTRFSGVGEELSQIVGSAQVKRTFGIFSKEQAIDEVFNTLITKGINDVDAKDMAYKLINSAEQVAKDSHTTLVEYGKEGFKDGLIKPNDNYMPIVYSFNTDEILKNKNFTHEDFTKFLGDSLIKGLIKRGQNPDSIPADTIREIANKLAYKMRKNEYRDDMHNKSLNDILLDEVMKTDNIPTNMKEYVSQFARERTFFDYTHTMEKVIDGKVTKLGFDDLVNKDFINIYNQYSKKMGGVTGLEKFKFKTQKTTYDFEEANKIRQGITDVIKSNRKLQKIVDRFTSGKPITAEAIFRSADTLYPMINKTINDVLGRELSLSDLSKLSNEERGAYLNKLIDDMVLTSNKMIEDNKDSIEELIGEKFADISDDIKQFVNDAENIFRGFADTVHNKIKELKELGETFTKEDYDALFKKEYDNLIKENKGIVDNINANQNKIFSKTEEKEYSLATQEGQRLYRSKIEKELKDKGVTGRTYQKELDRFDEIIKEMSGLPTAVNPNSLATQSQRALRNFNIARLLGQTAFTMSAELASVMVQNGVKNFIEFAPSSFKGIMAQIKTGKIDDKLAQEIQTFMGIGGDLYKAIGIGKYEHDFNILQMNNARAVDGFMNKAELVSEKFAEATLLFGGVKPLTNLFQMVTAMSSVNDIMKIATQKTLSKNDAKFLNEMGIGTDMLGRISSQIKQFGSTKKRTWSNGHKVSELGYENWTDEEAKRMLVTGIRRLTDTVVQQSHIGDKIGTMDLMGSRHLFRNTVLGKFALELKDYMITAYVKQFGRAYSRRDMFMFATIMTQASFLALSKTIQNQINYAGNDEKRKENMKPEKIAQSVIANLPMSSYLPQFIDTTTDTIFGERYLSDSRYHSSIQNSVMSLPSLDAIMKVGQLMSAVPETIREGEVSNKTINAMFGLAPLGNSVIAKPIHQSLLKE